MVLWAGRTAAGRGLDGHGALGVEEVQIDIEGEMVVAVRRSWRERDHSTLPEGGGDAAAYAGLTDAAANPCPARCAATR